MRKYITLLALVVLLGVVSVPVYAAQKSPTITVVVLSETESEIEVSLVSPKGEKSTKTIVTKKGVNYIRSPKLKAGKWKTAVNSYGDTETQSVDVKSGKYTVFYKVAPPRDGDSEQKDNVIQM